MSCFERPATVRAEVQLGGAGQPCPACGGRRFVQGPTGELVPCTLCDARGRRFGDRRDLMSFRLRAARRGSVDNHND